MKKLKVYQRLYDDLVLNEDVLGILLVGKAATTPFDEFDKLNDIDLIVLTAKGEKNRRVVQKIMGVDLDMSYLPVNFVKQCIKDHFLLWIEILASSKTVYDCGIDELVQESKDIWVEGTPELSPIQKEYWSFYLTTALEDIRNRLEDEALAKYLIGDYTTSLMRVMYKLNRRFIPIKKKRWLGQIREMDCQIANSIEAIIITPSLRKQFELTQGVYNRLIRELGGPVDTWSHEDFPEEL
jgi:hypothetical protein